MTDTQRLYVGIGISRYSDRAFAELPKAEEDVGRLGDHLDQHRGYRVETIPNPTEDEARSALKRYLKTNALPPGSTLVLLWAGHGEMAPEALHLIASDTERGSAPNLTPESLASFVARCGATQALLLLDTCFSGNGHGSVCWPPRWTSRGHETGCSSIGSCTCWRKGLSIPPCKHDGAPTMRACAAMT
jgi:hypothetical protein